MRWRNLALVVTFVTALSLYGVWGQSEKRVTIELKDAPIAEAFDQLLRAAGENFILMPPVPGEQRLTMRLTDVPFEKALNFLCDLTGLKWELKDNLYVISPKHPAVRDRAIRAIVVPPTGLPAPVEEMLRHLPDPQFWREFAERMRKWMPPAMAGLTLQCPKCRTAIHRECPQCKRPMRLVWQFCPLDGTKLPPAPEKCPKCGAPLPRKPNRISIGWRVERAPTIIGDVTFFFVPDEEMTVQVLDEQGKVLAERKLAPHQQHTLSLSILLGRKPDVGTYRLRMLDKEGREIAIRTVIIKP